VCPGVDSACANAPGGDLLQVSDSLTARLDFDVLANCPFFVLQALENVATEGPEGRGAPPLRRGHHEH
jgi:hypothetical protein